MNPLQQTTYEQAPTTAGSIATMYTFEGHNQPKAPASAEAPQERAPEPPPADVSDKWSAIKVFVDRLDAVLSTERDLATVLESRQTIGRRLADAYKRRDDAQAADNAQAWIQSEVRLEKVQSKCEPQAADRRATLRALGVQ